MIKKIVPHLVALLTFMLVSALYFAPQYQGKDVRQHDSVQASGMSGGIPEHIEKYGEHPQWAPNNFSGMPAYLIHMNYEGRIVKEVSSWFYFLGTPAAYYFIMMAGFYLMLLCFGMPAYLAMVGALAYGLSSYFYIIYMAGHITKLMALAWIAPLVGSMYYAYTRNKWLGAGLTGFFASVELSTSHPQIIYYFLFVMLGLVIVQGVRFYKTGAFPEFLRRSGLLLVAGALAVGSNLIQLWYVADYAEDSIRSRSELVSDNDDHEANKTSGLTKDYITAWSYGKMETFDLFIPNLYGGSSSGGFADDGQVAQSLEKYRASSYATSLPAYWGPQPMTSGPVYVGAIVVFLFILGLFLVRGANLWWLISVTALSFFLAWGHHLMWFTDLFLDFVPGYNKFRTVSMILVIAQWSMPLLGLLALRAIWKGEVSGERVGKALKYALGIAGGIALFFALFGGTIFDFSSATDAMMSLPDDVIAAMQAERVSMLRADAFRSLLFVLGAGGAVWLLWKQKISRNLFAALLAVLVLLDMVPVNKRYLDGADFVPKREAAAIKASPADQQILRDTTRSYRVANLSLGTFEDATTSYFHQSIGGYHAAKLRRYQEVIDRYLKKGDTRIYNMLNTRYFIVPDDQGSPVAQRNAGASGNAWFADTVLLVNNANEELDAIGQVNLLNDAVVDRKFAPQLEGLPLQQASDSTASLTLTDYRANRLTYRSKNDRAALAVFSEIYYPKGWTARIDGQDVAHLRADYILRALVVPAGEHEIVFSYRAPHFGALKTITVVSSLLLLALLAVGVWIAARKSRRS